MKVCIFIGLAGPEHGGLQVVTVRLAQYLKAMGHEVRIIGRFTQSQPVDYVRMEVPHVFTVEGVEIEIISIGGWRRLLLQPVRQLRRRPRTFSMAAALYEFVFRSEINRAIEGADLVHYFGYGIEMLGYAAQSGARRKGIPFVVQPAIHVGQSGHGPGDWPLYLRSDMVIAHSEFEAGTMRQHGVKASHVRAVRLGFDISEPGDGARFRKAHAIKGPIVLFLGRRCDEKGYFLLLEAFAALRQRVPNVTLVIAGPGTAAPSTADGVIELGRVPDEVKQDALSACTVFCLPSKGESFGIVYFEAWNYGKPVLALDFPVLRETIGASGGGLLVAPDRPGDLVENLQRLFEHPELAAAMGARGREFSHAYSWKGNAESCVAAYAQARQNQEQQARQ